jgi:molybdopterin-biosynthesis enzyme MoeA-like protein
MKTEILSIGTELMLGQIVDTNATTEAASPMRFAARSSAQT